MKTQFSKLTFTLFISLYAFVGWGQTTVTYNFATSGAVTGLNQAAPGISLDANIGFGSFKNSGTSNPGIFSNQLRLYQNATKGGSIKIYASNGVTITKVVIKASGTTGPAAFTVDGGSATNLSATTAYTMSSLTSTSVVEFYQKDGSSSNRIYVNEIEVTYTNPAPPPSTPTITLSESTISGLDYNLNNGPSANQTFTVSGTNLTANIVLNAPTNFHISTNAASGFGNSLTLTQSAGTVNSTTIYVRLISGLNENNYSGTLTAASTGATTENITLSGEVINECASENFSNLPTASSSSYDSRSWTGSDNVTWTAVGARTDQSITGRAICFGTSGDRWVTSPTYSGGIGTLKFKYVRGFTGTGGRSIQVWVNGAQQGGNITVSNTSDDVIQYEQTLNIGGAVVVQIRSVGASQVKIDDISWSCYAPSPTPTITLSANTITNLNYYLSYGPATNQTFTAQGADLTDNITLSAPPNFEISTSSTTGFASSLTLTQTAGTVIPTTIHTRLAANLGVGIYTGTLNATSSGASAQNISLNGKVLPTLTSIGVAYNEDFSSYSSAATVPSGWSVVSSGGVNGYIGAWGSVTAGGQRGAGVLGFQHTASSGVVTKTLTLLNDIGTTINQLEISYDGKVERSTEGRTPEYTVTVNGTTISGLAYSTASGVDESIIFTVTGLNILNGETVEIRWSSDRGPSSGSSRQIGIDNVTVMVPNNPALPVELSTFSGVYNKHFSVLNWETESEQNNDYFTLYHSTNGKSFEQIGRVSGSGNTSSLLSYTFEHREPRPGINYYKLTSTDYDGTIHDKGIIAVLVEMNHVFYDQITQSIQMNYSSDYAIYGSDGRLITRVENQNAIPFSGFGIFHVIDERSGESFKLGVW